MTRCARCVYDTSVPGIAFDAVGVCNYCHIHDQMDREYPTGAEGQRQLGAIVDQIKAEGRAKPYDVVVGVSGGCDSTYMLRLAKDMGLRPLAVHFDNTWDSSIAVENIHAALSRLDIELSTYVIDHKEQDDIFRSFIRSGTPDIDVATDIALAVTLNMACEEHGIRYIFEGHSFRTEGLSPLGWIYMDGRYISAVHQQFGSRPMKTFPNMPLGRFLHWTTRVGIRKIRPLYYVDYVKKDAMAMLTRDLGWQWYGGHHLENRYTAFVHQYFFPRRYGVDSRLLGYAASVRSGQMSREEAIALTEQPIVCDRSVIDLVKKRMGFSDEEFEALMTAPKKTYRDYPNYKRTFEWMKPYWWLMYKLKRVPKSFYIKWTTPDPVAFYGTDRIDLVKVIEA